MTEPSMRWWVLRPPSMVALLGLLVILAAPFATEAQHGRAVRIGWLAPESIPYTIDPFPGLRLGCPALSALRRADAADGHDR